MKNIFIEAGKTVPRLTDIGTAVAYLGISRSTIRNLMDSGRLSRVLLTSFSQSQSSMGCLLLDRADLDAVIDRGKNRPNS